MGDIKVGHSCSFNQALQLLHAYATSCKVHTLLLHVILSQHLPYINDLLLFIQNSDICNFAGDTTIYERDKNMDNIAHRLENDCAVA